MAPTHCPTLQESQTSESTQSYPTDWNRLIRGGTASTPRASRLSHVIEENSSPLSTAARETMDGLGAVGPRMVAIARKYLPQFSPNYGVPDITGAHWWF